MVKWWELLIFSCGFGLGYLLGFIHGWNKSTENIGILIEKREGERVSKGREGGLS